MALMHSRIDVAREHVGRQAHPHALLAHVSGLAVGLPEHTAARALVVGRRWASLLVVMEGLRHGLEMLYTAIAIMAGVFMLAIVIGNVASILANLDAVTAAKRERLASINHYMRTRKAPRRARARRARARRARGGRRMCGGHSAVLARSELAA